MTKYLIVFLMATTVSSCRENKSESKSEAVDDKFLEFEAPVPQNSAQEEMEIEIGEKSKKMAPFIATPDTSRKIIKTGDLSFEAKDLKSTRLQLIMATRRLHGYISDEKEFGYEKNRKEIILSLKIPAQNFDALLNAISSVAGKIDSKNISIEDITSEYIDTQTRLKNKKKLEIRYLELLQKTSKISEMLQIENKLSEIRTEIESVEAQFLQMRQQVAYSSLKVTFYSKTIAGETRTGFFFQVQEALSAGMLLIERMFYGILSIWPVVLVLALLFLFFYRRNRSKV